MQKIKYFWAAPPRWSDLSKIGNSKVANSTIIWMFFVPVLARILKPVNEIEINFGGQIFSIALALPFAWELLFYSSFAFALGTAFYHVECPRFLKLYTNYPEFIESGQVDRTILSVFSRTLTKEESYQHLTKFREAAYQFTLDYLTNGEELAERMRNSATTREQISDIFFNAEIDNGRSREAFLYLYNFSEDLNRNSRRCIFVLYLIGFAFFGLILAQNIWYVASV